MKKRFYVKSSLTALVVFVIINLSRQFLIVLYRPFLKSIW